MDNDKPDSHAAIYKRGFVAGKQLAMQTSDIRLWDHYAAHALQGILASNVMTLGNPEAVAETVAEHVNAIMTERVKHVKGLLKKPLP